MEDVFPELPMSLLCQGTLEKGADASNGIVAPLEFYNMCVDGAGLAIVADSFSALRQRIETDHRITWDEIINALETDYKDAEIIRLMMRSVPRYGSGGSIADKYAIDIVQMFNRLVKSNNTPILGHPMIPGLFSWANTIPMGKAVGATPDGRHAQAPISHGANPTPGFKEGGALTAVANAVASVQCHYGNTTPIQLEVDPMVGMEEGGVARIVQFINTYCNILKGTLMNLNIINKQTILEAHKDPSQFPDLIVRVTGFSAYFATLSEDFRQLVVDRIIEDV
jgi:formate C-acetyltransferase